MKVSEALVARLVKLNTAESLDLVKRFWRGEVSEQELARQAGRFLQITRSDAGQALQRAARLHTPRTIEIPKALHAKIFATVDRGKKVTAVEQGIRDGSINPVEILNYA